MCKLICLLAFIFEWDFLRQIHFTPKNYRIVPLFLVIIFNSNVYYVGRSNYSVLSSSLLEKPVTWTEGYFTFVCQIEKPKLHWFPCTRLFLQMALIDLHSNKWIFITKINFSFSFCLNKNLSIWLSFFLTILVHGLVDRIMLIVYFTYSIHWLLRLS